uniref:Putative salivary secreted protein n=1 Tax=Ornithodoros parkeri TaxID=140564 RepID=A6N9V1_ORNPR|nr:putative salivary secreted protein [Ornithodoros parkeri]
MKRSSPVVLYLSLSFTFHVFAVATPCGKCTDIEGHHFRLPVQGFKTDYDGCVIVMDIMPCKYLCYKPYVRRDQIEQWRNRPDGIACTYTYNNNTLEKPYMITIHKECKQGICF